MDKPRGVVFAVRMLLNQIQRLLESDGEKKKQITSVQGHVIGYMSHHTEQDIYQRDLERELEVRRSTASAIVKTMEKNGLLRHEPVAYDARLKKLMLTPRAMAINAQHRRRMDQMEALITCGVSAEELKVFFQVIERFELNLKNAAEAGNKVCGGEEKE